MTFEDVLAVKEKEITERSLINTRNHVRNWISINGSNKLSSITTASLNRFARELKKPKCEGGRGFVTNAANDASTKIRALIKTYNVNLAGDHDRIEIPEWDPIRLTIAEKKQKKVEQRDVRPEDARELLAYAKARDQGAWRAILILSNTTFRVTECCLLKWGDVKCKDGIYYFDLSDSKTVEGIRRFPLNSRLRQHLLPIRGNDDEYIVNNKWPHRKSPRNACGHFLRQAKVELGIQGNTNPHSFRHFTGGQSGYEHSEHLKKKLMGHSGGMTDHYTREDMRKMNEAVEDLGFDF